MTTQRITAQSRQRLDSRFQAMGSATIYAPPVRGWIRAVRDALGMTTAQFAKRMQIKQPSAVAMEKSELKGTIQLATLRRAAEAMNCTLVYALVPRDSLEAIVREQARRIAVRSLQSVEHSMALEDQRVPTEDLEASIDALSRDVSPRRLWDDE